MTFGRDPYAVLGLPVGAPQAEVKRAYRRLAKAFHPDAAGPSAMPRFLAIQAAYEQLTGESAGGGQGGTNGGSRAARPRPEAWRADADRARAARDGWRRRAGRPGGGGGAPAGGAATDSSGSPRGTGDAADRKGGGPRRGSRRPSEAGRRATPGSTSYDEAEHEPFDPEWSGASWYGQSSGTYWTINPREYADPRKHGPEYQARARRAAESGDPDPDAAAAAGAERPSADATTEANASGSPRPGDPSFRAYRRPGDTAPGGGASTGAGDRGAAWARSPGDGPPRTPPRTPPEPPSAGAGAGWPTVEGLVPQVFSGPGSRLALALVGWPPLGLGLAWLVGELSGCGRFSAACSGGVEAFGLGNWLIQLLVIAGLLLVPRAAAISAVGTVGMLAAAVPAAVLLSISGGARAPEAAASALGVFLVGGYLGGVIIAVLRRSRTIRA